MVAKCANPNCQVPFRYFRSGRLFNIEMCDKTSAGDDGQNVRQRARAEFFWLCEACSSKVTLMVHEGTVVVEPICERGIDGAIELVIQPRERIRESVRHVVSFVHPVTSKTYSRQSRRN